MEITSRMVIFLVEAK